LFGVTFHADCAAKAGGILFLRFDNSNMFHAEGGLTKPGFTPKRLTHAGTVRSPIV
jgi:hypothetical protein